jgi:hypothetical protein
MCWVEKFRVDIIPSKQFVRRRPGEESAKKVRTKISRTYLAANAPVVRNSESNDLAFILQFHTALEMRD